MARGGEEEEMSFGDFFSTGNIPHQRRWNSSKTTPTKWRRWRRQRWRRRWRRHWRCWRHWLDAYTVDTIKAMASAAMLTMLTTTTMKLIREGNDSLLRDLISLEHFSILGWSSELSNDQLVEMNRANLTKSFQPWVVQYFLVPRTSLDILPLAKGQPCHVGG